MLSEKQLFLVIAIVCLFLLIIFKLVKSQTEGFEVQVFTPSPSTTPSADGVFTPSPNVCANSKNWWELEVPKQVVSYVSGVRFPIHAIDPNKPKETLFQIPYIKSGETDASGCLSIETTGTYTTKMCDSNSSEQRWKLVQIKDKTIFSNLLESGKDNYSGVNQNYDTPAGGIPFGFFMVISESDKSMVLASNGGNLTVQRIGNYTSQFWDITKDTGNANIAIYDTNHFTNLGSNFTNPLNPLNPLNPSTDMTNKDNSNKLTSLQSPTQMNSLNNLTGETSNGLSSLNKSQPLNINLNLDQKSLMALFGSVDTTGPGINNIISSLPSQSPEGFNNNSNCKPCPSILTDYIAKNNIPCLGCKL